MINLLTKTTRQFKSIASRLFTILKKYKLFRFLLFFLATLTLIVVISYPIEVLARSIDIRDENGEVTTWGWWLINIGAPFFLPFEILKIFIGIITLPLLLFGNTISLEFLLGAWSNLTVMWPGMLVWSVWSINNEQGESKE